MIHTPTTNPLIKHVGYHNDKKCVVILQLPEEPNLVHIVDTESLPNQIHQNLMDIIDLPESQAVQWLGDILNRRMLADGTNALRTLYERNFVQQVPITQVVLSPRPNIKIPLTEVIGYINQTADPLAAPQNLGEKTEEHAKSVTEEQAKLDAGLVQTEPTINQHAENLASDKKVATQGIANGLIIEAQMLEAEAARKRAQAAQYTGVPVTPSATATATAMAAAMPTPTVKQFVDPVTGREYKNASALKGAITRREKAANG